MHCSFWRQDLRVTYIKQYLQWNLILVASVDESNLNADRCQIVPTEQRRVTTFAIIADRARTWYAPREKPVAYVNAKTLHDKDQVITKEEYTIPATIIF